MPTAPGYWAVTHCGHTDNKERTMRTFSENYLKRITSEIFRACGAPRVDADIVSKMLVTSNLMGINSHGIMRVSQYVSDVREGRILPGFPVKIIRETATTAIIDAGWNFGQIGALETTRVAIKKAKTNGLGCVVVRRCRHVGRLGAYPEIAAEKNLVGLAMSSSAGEGHWVCPWGGREGRLGTNPFAFAVPTGGNPFVLDFSTSRAPEGKIRLMLECENKLPNNWIVDGKGHASINPKDLYGPPQGAILPFGNDQGYKGYALSLMVQIMSSLLGDPSWKKKGAEANANNMWFLAINISAFMPPSGFRNEMDKLISYVKSSALAYGFKKIFVPGEPEFLEMKKRKTGGIPIAGEAWKGIEKIARELKVKL